MHRDQHGCFSTRGMWSACVCVHVCAFVRVYTCVCECVRVCARACVCTRMCLHVCACVHAKTFAVFGAPWGSLSVQGPLSSARSGRALERGEQRSQGLAVEPQLGDGVDGRWLGTAQLARSWGEAEVTEHCPPSTLTSDGRSCWWDPECRTRLSLARRGHSPRAEGTGGK